ncbi:hypothetical protein [Haloglomus litoreum]|uniref:hypothetical protein n=1 Tax=Haloglomus litoreum TaxID=3034026 RepID=UPI0023E852AA|nr:hypothetical protein [Haloglomus sp. DT116]
MSLDGATRAAPTPEDTDLPAIVAVRTRAVEGDRRAVVVAFENGAAVRYRRRDGSIEERWIPPEGSPEDPAATHRRDADAGVEALALRLVGEYLSFDGRRRAAFVWGETNTNALLGE